MDVLQLKQELDAMADVCASLQRLKTKQGPPLVRFRKNKIKRVLNIKYDWIKEIHNAHEVKFTEMDGQLILNCMRE